MSRVASLQYRPVKAIPRQIDDGVLYVSNEYATAVHRCCCGCGHEVVTPLGPTDWRIQFEDGAVSVYPSIGNWSLPCRSHYWIARGQIHWAEQWSQERVEYGRACDRARKQRQYGEAPPARPGFWTSLWHWLTGR